MQKSNNRLNRIEEEIKKEISNIINYELNDPKIKGIITITKVKITPDLRYARVYISMLELNKKDVLKVLKKSSGYIRKEIAHKINLRVTPELVFEFDESIEYGSKIDSIIKEIMNDMKPK